MSWVWISALVLCLALIAPGEVQGQNSPPDIYEDAPYFDDSSATTQNTIPFHTYSRPASQSHTIDSDDDVDWGICAQSLGQYRLWTLVIDNPVIPPGSRILVELFENGPLSPPTKISVILPGQESGTLTWRQDPLLDQVLCSVRALGSSSPAMSYSIFRISPPTGTLPVNPIEERTIHMAPAGGGAGGPLTAAQGPAQITPGEGSSYTMHIVEFPGYELTGADDPSRIDVTMRSATLFERASTSGGQSFPTQSGALFVIETHSALGQPIAFSDPVDITVQFEELAEYWKTDVVTLDTMLGQPHQMRLVRDTLEGLDVDFDLLRDARESVDLTERLVTLDGLVGLTGSDGRGTWGAAVDPAVTVSLGFDDLIGHLIGTALIPHTYQSQVDHNDDWVLDAADVVAAINASSGGP